MNRLYRVHILPRENLREETGPADNPIIRDNKSFDLPDGNEKSLDYIGYMGMLNKGNLAAHGVIKLYPYGTGVLAVPSSSVKFEDSPSEGAYKEIPEEDDMNFENEWDNIFLKGVQDSDIPMETLT